MADRHTVVSITWQLLKRPTAAVRQAAHLVTMTNAAFGTVPLWVHNRVPWGAFQDCVGLTCRAERIWQGVREGDLGGAAKPQSLKPTRWQIHPSTNARQLASSLGRKLLRTVKFSAAHSSFRDNPSLHAKSMIHQWRSAFHIRRCFLCQSRILG